MYVGQKEGNGKQNKIKLPLRFREAFSNRAWEGFQNRLNIIHPDLKCIKRGYKQH